MTLDQLAEVIGIDRDLGEPEEPDWREGWWMACLAGGCCLVMLSLVGLFILGCVRWYS